jgi:hypothetical protein
MASLKNKKAESLAESNAAVGRKVGERSDFTRSQLDYIEKNFAAIVELAVQEVFNAPD